MSRLGSPNAAQTQQQTTPLEQQQAPVVDLSKLEQTLSQVVERGNQNQLMTQLMQDPDYAALMQAKAQGRPVRVMLDEPQQPKPEPLPKFEEMTEAERGTYFLEQIDKRAEAKAKQQLQPLQQQVQQLQGYAQNEGQRQAVQQIQAVQQKYADFGDVLPKMKEIVQQGIVGPSATAEQTYLIASQLLGRTPKFVQQVQQERPTHSAARPPLQDLRKQPLPPGRSGFNQLLAESLARLDIPDDVG